MNQIGWLINRLRVMSLSEVLFRVRRSVVQRLEQRRVGAGWQPQPAKTVQPKTSLLGQDADLISRWGRQHQLDHLGLDAYLAGRINFFGHEPLDVGNPVAWHRDPVTGIEAPLVFGKTLNYRDDSVVGNVKFIWELGRHQHLVPLAIAYAVTGELRYREAIAEQIDGWIEQNPYAMGIHWCSALEVSLRLISWSLVHSLLAVRDGEEGLFAAVQDSASLGAVIYQQAHFVRHFLSRYSSANNHLIGELSGLWVACQVFDLGEQGRVWSNFAQEELERESGLQVHTDGVDKEQAFYYHLWVLEYLFFVWLVGARCNHPFSEAFTSRILAMARFLEDASPDGGEPPQVGDADDGFVARFQPTWSPRPYRELLDAIASVFGGADDGNSEKAFWYCAMAKTDKTPYPVFEWQRSYPVIYPQGGYAVLGGAGCHLVFDAGPLGYLGIAAHGHADALSFCLAIDGEWWLVDPGTYAYHSDSGWRSYFRGTSAHNTIRVNRQDQSQIGGAFMWLRKAVAGFEAVAEENNEIYQIVKGRHDGYAAIGVSHCRELKLSAAKQQLEIVDTLKSRGRQGKVAEIYYHFAPDVDIEPGPEAHCWIAVREDRKKRLVI